MTKNIIDMILEIRKKYIILISGIIWWGVIRRLIYYISKTLNFEIILLESKLFPTKLQDMKFIELNDKIRNKLNLANNNNLYCGVIIVGFTFPTNMIDIPLDIHINISVDSLLMNKLINEIQIIKQLKRLQIEESNIFINNTISQNKIFKSFKLSNDYENEINLIYHQICQLIFDNIEKKLYGDNYNEFKSKKLDIVNDENFDLNSISINDDQVIDINQTNKDYKSSDDTSNKINDDKLIKQKSDDTSEKLDISDDTSDISDISSEKSEKSDKSDKSEKLDLSEKSDKSEKSKKSDDTSDVILYKSDDVKEKTDKIDFKIKKYTYE